MATAPGWPGNNLTGPYWVFPESGTIQRQSNPILRIGLLASGWVGFDTFAHAKAFASGNAISKAKKVTKDVAHDLKKAASWTQAIGRFFARLSDWHLWASLGWIALGIILMLIGLRLWIGKLTPAGTPGPIGFL